MITAKDLVGKRVVCKTCGCAPETQSWAQYIGMGLHGKFGCKHCGTWEAYAMTAYLRGSQHHYQNAFTELCELAAQKWFAKYGTLLPALPEVDPREEYALMGEW